VSILTRAIGTTLLLSALTATVVSAHFGSSAAIIVPADSILPGQEFEVVAIDLTPEATVNFDIRREDAGLTVPLESATSSADGHFRLSLSIPSDFPSGYAQLYAFAADGTQAMTWVFVGERTSATPPPPGTPPWFADPSVIVLGVIAIGAVAAVAYMALRRRRVPAVALPASEPSRRSRRTRRT
jgi:hypothetical protein